MQKVHHTDKDGVTAFQGSEAALRGRCKDAKLSPAEFQRKLSRCSLSTCRGMCCYGGVSVDDGTAAVLQQLSTERASDFRDMGLELPEAVVAPTEWHGTVGNITALKTFAFRSLDENYPAQSASGEHRSDPILLISLWAAPCRPLFHQRLFARGTRCRNR